MSCEDSEGKAAAAGWFIKENCIGCGACVEAAPALLILNEERGVAEVVRQPSGEGEMAGMRLGASLCPVRAIGVCGGRDSV